MSSGRASTPSHTTGCLNTRYTRPNSRAVVGHESEVLPFTTVTPKSPLHSWSLERCWGRGVAAAAAAAASVPASVTEHCAPHGGASSSAGSHGNRQSPAHDEAAAARARTAPQRPCTSVCNLQGVGGQDQLSAGISTQATLNCCLPRRRPSRSPTGSPRDRRGRVSAAVDNAPRPPPTGGRRVWPPWHPASPRPPSRGDGADATMGCSPAPPPLSQLPHPTHSLPFSHVASVSSPPPPNPHSPQPPNPARPTTPHCLPRAPTRAGRP